MSATMITAAIATIATVDAARITYTLFPVNRRAKLAERALRLAGN
jgi:hypothetical protein